MSNPRLRSDLTIIERVLDGTTSYVVKDPVAHSFFRFGSTEMAVMRALDGRHTFDDVAGRLNASGIELSSSAIGSFVTQLSAAGLLELSVAEQCARRLERLRAEPPSRRWFRGELLRMRWSFGDPDALLDRVLPAMRRLLKPGVAFVALALLMLFTLLLSSDTHGLSTAIVATYAPRNLTAARVAVVWLTAGAVILIHELGHAVACKHFGGEVHEMGFMLLYLQPAFYCNVDDAWTFPERRKRLWVNAAGTVTELCAIGAAIGVWLIAAPETLISEMALAALLFSGVTTILGNLNPLLPLDGYFALSDWLEIPNLRQRAASHVAWWIKRRIFRLDVDEPSATSRERRVFFVYGTLSALYIAAIMTIVMVLAVGWLQRVAGALGIIAALVATWVITRRRIAKWTRAARDALRVMRPLWWAIAGIGVLLAVIPWPITAHGAFVARPMFSTLAAAPDSGIVDQVFVTQSTRVAAGAPLVRLVNPSLERRWIDARRRADSLGAAATVARASGRSADAERLSTEQTAQTASAAAIDRLIERLTVRAPTSGVMLTARPEDLVGRRVKPGEAMLMLAAIDSVELRVSIRGAGATRIRSGDVVHLVSHADVLAPWTAQVVEVSSTGSAASGIEVRLRRDATSAWRTGVTGEASIELARSTLLGALWWKARQLVRVDLLL